MRAIVVGTGFGCRVHVPALQSAGIEVAALVGRDLEKTRRRAVRSGVEGAYSSLTEALRLPGVEVVIVAGPPYTHAPLALEALSAGRHVLVEKPFTLNAAEARELHVAAEANGVLGFVGHEFRFSHERVTIAREVAHGAIGRPRLATFIWHLPLVAPLDARVPEWWFDSARGGGWLGASISHFVDAVRVWFGEIAVVNATLPMVSDRDPSTMAEDSAVLRFRTLSGCEVIIGQTASVWGGEFQVLRIAGTEGDLAMENDRVLLATAEGVTAIELDPYEVEVTPSDDPRHQFTHLELGPAARQARAVKRLIAGGSLVDEPVQPATFADGVACMEVLDAARRSAAADGSTVTIS